MLYRREKGLVSVIITSYNIAPYIKECLDSILVQTYKNIEVIIIDDASSDNTVSLVEKWKKQNQLSFPLVLIALPRNVGFAAALNIGYSLSKGEYIAVQDGDDLSHPERIEKQVAFLSNNPLITLVGSTYHVFSDGNFEQQTKANWIKYGDKIPQTYLAGGHCVCHGTILFKGEIFDRIGGPTRRITGAEDYEFIAKCLNAKYKIENIPEVLYYYRSHAKQRSKEFYHKGV